MTCFIFADSRVLVSLPEMILMVADYVCIVFQTDSNFLNVSLLLHFKSYSHLSKSNKLNFKIYSFKSNPKRHLPHIIYLMLYSLKVSELFLSLFVINDVYACLLSLNEWNNLS